MRLVPRHLGSVRDFLFRDRHQTTGRVAERATKKTRHNSKEHAHPAREHTKSEGKGKGGKGEGKGKNVWLIGGDEEEGDW